MSKPVACPGPDCGRPLVNVVLFCRECWFKLPAAERVALSRMYRRKADLRSKMAKAVRLLEERRA